MKQTRAQTKAERLRAELAEQCDPSSDPVLHGHVGVECYGDDVVGGVSGGGQGAASLACLVDGRQITHPLRNVPPFHGLQPHLTERSTRCDKG